MVFSNLAVDTFLALRNTFFEHRFVGKPFHLRAKANTQDDPLDVLIAQILSSSFSTALCHKSPGPLISPDMVIFRPSECERVSRTTLKRDVSRIIGIEIKKIGRGTSGQVSRPTGLDYNTTPPCGTVRVYDSKERVVDIRGFYLFLCLEPTGTADEVMLSALTLCDGNILNADFDLYLSITGQRSKGIGLGTYGDGMNRNRPMLVFPNPLGAPQFDRSVTLILQSDEPRNEHLGLVYEIGRTIPEGGSGAVFRAYRHVNDIPTDWEPERLVDPFPKPLKRVIATQGRGKFRLPINTFEDEPSN